MISGPVPILGMVSQRLQRILCPQGPVFRGWWVVGSGALANFFGAILFMQAFGAYVLLIESMLVTTRVIFYSCLNPIVRLK